MTADDVELKTSSSAIVPTEIEVICDFLSCNDKIIFKSQQIDDPELDRSEKIHIAKELYLRNRQTFLQRFGIYFEEQHLVTFKRLASAEVKWNPYESSVEIQDMLQNYERRLHTHKRDVKNRRYAAMQQLIRQGEYFSELEMMRRAPETYQELIGQYLSAKEIKQRDSYDVKNTTFSGILMHSLEQQQREEMLKEADDVLKRNAVRGDELENGESQEGEDEDTNCVEDAVPNNIADEYEVPQSCRQQWGNFENEPIACSTTKFGTKNKLNKSSNKDTNSNALITAGERALLRQEFVDFMYEQFLDGKDANYDYTLIDENTQLDDLSQLNQDKEDAYFATSDDDEASNEEENPAATTNSNDAESEDELDLYMRHLNQHHSLKS